MTNLKAFLAEERARYAVYPDKQDVFRAFDLTPPNKIKVVILGQDPYFTPYVADGLAFSSKKVDYMPPSMEIILAEVYENYHLPFNKVNHKICDLTSWAEQGVFLLNRILTVREGKAKTHENKGWEQLTTAAIKVLSDDFRQKVFMLWGSEAQKLEHVIDPTRHLILKAPHPAAHLYNSRAKKFFPGCKHFSRANAFLKNVGVEPIHWPLI